MPKAKGAPALEADLEATERRIASLQTYMETEVLSGSEFRCTSADACRASLPSGVTMAEGQLSHVGHHYDLLRDGRPLRVMVVGQEYGGSGAHVDLLARYGQVYQGSGLEKRYYKEPGHVSRNPHMRGTTSALRLIFGKGLGADYSGETLQTENGMRFHIFDAFSLVNVLLCGAHSDGKSEGKSTKTMRRHCLRHFSKTVDILQPTLIVLQGQGVQEWIAPVLGLVEELSPNLARASFGWGSSLVIRFSHPSAHGALRWGDRLDSPYLIEVVEPTIRQAISLEDE